MHSDQERRSLMKKYSVELGFTWIFPVKQIETVKIKFEDLYRILVVFN